MFLKLAMTIEEEKVKLFFESDRKMEDELPKISLFNI